MSSRDEGGRIDMCEACGVTDGRTRVTACGQELCSSCREHHDCRLCYDADDESAA